MASTIKLKNGSGAPLAGDLVQGEPALDLTNKRLYTENASGVVIEVGTNPSTIDINAGTIDGTVIGGSSAAAGSFTTISASGEIAANGGIALGDNDRATFGGSDDLQIWHDGSNSYVKDSGTGDLKLQGNNFTIGNTADAKYFTATNGGAVELYHQGNQKLATTATGIDVTGTATMDGLTVDGVTKIGFASAPTWDTNSYLYSISGDGLHIEGFNQTFSTGSSRTNRLKITSDGDISFYEDTGTTAKFFWDASAESLGIGTTSPEHKLSVFGDSSGNRTEIGIDNIDQRLVLGAYFEAGIGQYSTIQSTDNAETSAQGLVLQPDGGNVGIGTTSPSNALDVAGNIKTTNATYNFVEVSSGTVQGQFAANGGGALNIRAVSNHPLEFYTNNTERARLDSSGNLLVGTTTANSDNAGHGFLAGNIAYHTRAGATLILNRLSTDGTIAEFRKNGATAGSIGVYSDGASAPYFADAGNVGIRLSQAGVDDIVPCDSTGANRDAAINLGAASARWSVIYAATGTINTSDEREKTPLEDLDAAELAVAKELKAAIKKFKFKDAVEAKGEAARLHVGVGAQTVKAIFESHGLVAEDYAILCYDEWDAEFDEDGNETRPAGSRYGVRYEELLAFIIAAI